MVDRPDYAAMAQEVEALAAQVVPRFHGEALEDIEIIFKEFAAVLDLTNTILVRAPKSEQWCVVRCIYSAQNALPDLRHYDIDPAVIQRFETMASDLNAWSGELRARGFIRDAGPPGPAPEPI